MSADESGGVNCGLMWEKLREQNRQAGAEKRR